MYSLAFGIGTRNSKQEWLEVFFPEPLFKPGSELISQISGVLGYEGGNRDIDLDDDKIQQLTDSIDESRQKSILSMMKGSSKPCIATFIESDTELSSTPEAYLKLHLLSYRYVKPNEQNLHDIYAILPNVAWTDIGAVDLAELGDLQLEARTHGRVLEVAGIDKFPKMTNYVAPTGVRIAHSARVRLGAYLGRPASQAPFPQ